MAARTGGFALIAAALALGACDGAAPPATVSRGAFRSLSVSREIPPDEVATIDRGTEIAAGKDVTLTVRGRLVLAAGSGPHSRISPAVAGDTWGGIIVASGGVVELRGLDLDGATTAVTVQTGATSALYEDGTITNVGSPFQVERSAALDVGHAKVVGATRFSGISGAFRATYLDYQKMGADGGLIMNDANATFDVGDSSFRGTEDAGGDYIISYGAKAIRLSYSTITGAHCAFHFNDVARFEIDHVTAGALTASGPGDLVAWGAMLYGSGSGPNVISNSNFISTTLNLEQQGVNGPLTITNTYTTGKNEPAGPGWTWLPADVAATRIVDAQPR
jgi:hypothetical protein